MAIRNNLIDVRDSEVVTTGNGIVVQATTGTTHVGPVLIENNTIIGGSNQGTITKILSNAIYVFGNMKDVTIRNNVITRTGQSGIHIEGTRFLVENNKLTDPCKLLFEQFGGVNVELTRILQRSWTYVFVLRPSLSPLSVFLIH